MRNCMRGLPTREARKASRGRAGSALRIEAGALDKVPRIGQGLYKEANLRSDISVHLP